MKKKNNIVFLLISILFLGYYTNVNAIEINPDDIPNNTYVIGNCMFSDEIVLTTKHIMLGATTINSSDLDDMVIYYKTPRGKWIDGLDGETVTAPTTFEIEYVDTEPTDDLKLLGDVNLDGLVNTTDVVALRRYINEEEISESYNIDLGDANNDGDIDYVDVEIIRKYIAGGYGVNVLPYDSGDQYSITYDYDGGTRNSSNILEYAQISLPFKLENPTKDGYVFIGWTGSNGDTPDIDVTITKGTTGVLSYTANWAALGDVDKDGTINMSDVLAIAQHVAGEIILDSVSKALADVNLDNEVDDVDTFILVKYFVDGNETKPEGYNISIPYASGDKYTITYDLNGGKISNNKVVKYAQVTLPYTLIKPAKDGYVFTGWTGSNGDTPQKEVTIEKGITGDLSYTANWELLGDVTLDGLITTEDVVVIRRHIHEHDIPIPYNIDLGDVNEDGDIDYIDVEILRKFIVGGYGVNVLPYDSGDQYNITYDYDGGEISEFNDYNILKYAQISLPFKLTNPTKDGYVFTGWTGSNGDTPQLEVTIPKGTTGNLSYTANWESE